MVSGSVFGVSPEIAKFDPSKTIIHSTNENFIDIENPSSKLYYKPTYLDKYLPNPKYQKVATKECEKFPNKTFKETIEGENIREISDYRGKFYCVTLDEEIMSRIQSSENGLRICRENDMMESEICQDVQRDLKNQKLDLKDLRAKQKTQQASNQIDSQQKKMETCQAYGFEVGSEPFGQCIFKLMELELEYAKLENEQLRLQAQAEQAKLSNQTALAQSLASQAQASNRDKGLRLQQFGLAMQGIANSFQTPSSMVNPKITCQNIGLQMKCW